MSYEDEEDDDDNNNTNNNYDDDDNNNTNKQFSFKMSLIFKLKCFKFLVSPFNFITYFYLQITQILNKQEHLNKTIVKIYNIFQIIKH